MSRANSVNRAWPPKTADGAFATTQWTMIFEAARSSQSEPSPALERLCQIYWPPVYAFIRRMGHSVEEAKDLTQGFFVNVLNGEAVTTANPAKGKFRTYLLGAVKFHLARTREKACARKRGSGMTTLAIDISDFEQTLDSALTETETPERLFEKQWISVLLKETAAELRADYDRRCKGELCEVLMPFVMDDVSRPASYKDLAVERGVSAVSLRMAASRMRQRFGEILREKIAATVDSPEEVEEEIRGLLRSLN